MPQSVAAEDRSRREVAYHSYPKGMSLSWGTLYLIDETPEGFSFALTPDGEPQRNGQNELVRLPADELNRFASASAA